MLKESPRRLFSALRSRRVPVTATVELSYACNLRCAHCFNPTHSAGPRELSFEEHARLFADMAALGVLDVCLTGGEPALHPRFFALVEAARGAGLTVSMNTNATRLTPSLAARLSGAGLSGAYVSIYGDTRAVYESVTGVPGSFDAFEAGLSALLDAGVPTTLQMPLMTLNADELPGARARARRLGVRLLPTFDIYPRQDGDPSPLRYRLPPERKARLLAEGLAPLHCQADGASFFDCDCGKAQLAVTPYGELNLCTIFPLPKYDLRRGSLRDGWEALKRFVDDARPGPAYECPSCDLRPHCRQGRADGWLEARDASACLPHYEALAALEKDAHERR